MQFLLPKPLVLISCMLLASAARATCYAEAESLYRIPAPVLRAIAKAESGGKIGAVGKNPGSMDLGLMQINDSHLPRLKQYGITRSELLSDGCLNLKVGASILREAIDRHGFNWNAIGAYNVGCAKLSRDECHKRRNRYAWRIYRAYAGTKTASSVVQPEMQTPHRGTTYLTFASHVTEGVYE